MGRAPHYPLFSARSFGTDSSCHANWRLFTNRAALSWRTMQPDRSGDSRRTWRTRWPNRTLLYLRDGSRQGYVDQSLKVVVRNPRRVV